LTFDYLGALLASLAFPLFLVPRLGLVRGAFFVGVLNALVAVASTHVFAAAVGRPGRLAFPRSSTRASFSTVHGSGGPIFW
jgi:spermidine synthase